MGITGSVAGITGSAIEIESTGSLFVTIVFILAVIGIGIFLIRRRNKLSPIHLSTIPSTIISKKILF